MIAQLGGFVYVRNMTEVADRVVLQLRRGVFKSISGGCDSAFFDEVPVEEVTSALGTDAARVRDLLWQSIQTDRGVRAAMESTLGMVMVLALSARIAAIYAVSIPLVASVSALSGLRMAKLFGEEAMARNKATAGARESLGAWKTVLSFGTAGRELKKYEAQLHAVDDEVSAVLRPRKALNDFYGRAFLRAFFYPPARATL